VTLWSAEAAAVATGGRSTIDWAATGISIDTRTLQRGDLFVALKAARDGHVFVADALSKGAAAALVSHVPEDVPEDAPLLVVDDVLVALEALARTRRAESSARVVAITGSAGKTSTKEMLRTILADQGRTHASAASYNNHWGVPLTLARMPADTDFAVIEIGMNHPGEIAPLSRLARPHVAIITTVAAAHLEAFDDIAGIAAEKASILEGLEPAGAAILNCDVETSDVLQDKAKAIGCRRIGFGLTAHDFRLDKAEIMDDVTVTQAFVRGRKLLFKVSAPGQHFAMNGLAALAAAEEVGADLALAAQSLGRWTPYKGRGAREVIRLDAVDERQTLELIDESYNANPASMAAALEVLAAARPRHDIGRVSQGRRIAILGDMMELGPEAPALHAGLARLPAMEQVDQVHCVGPMMQHLYAVLPEAKRAQITQTSEDMAAWIRGRLDAGDVVMVKGSLSMKLGLVVDAIRKMGDSGRQSAQRTE
jgi:UDP-N-acetylmuramoyl-tripeptide--D-alanyl-D-alanine ligase